MIKGSIHQKDIYAPNIRAPKYTKQTLTELKGEINSNIIIGRNFNTSLSAINNHPDR